MITMLSLPKLNRLSPNMQSTLLKIIEEAGELARAVLTFLPYEHLGKKEILTEPLIKGYLDAVSSELLDVAQTCVTMIFVLEEECNVKTERYIDNHLKKLSNKGYNFNKTLNYNIYTENNFKYLALPKLLLPKVTLLTTVCKIQEEVGELTQYLGKKAGASGESEKLDFPTILNGSVQELLDVAQCCFTMLYILADRYDVDTIELVEDHVNKLKRKGYCV